jgi:hypothetical protein
MRRHPDATTADDVMDLWLRVRPGRRGYKAIRAGGVDVQWRGIVEAHVDQLLRRCDPNVPRERRERVADVVPHVGRVARSVVRESQAAAAGAGEADDEGDGGEDRTEGAWPDHWAGPDVMTASGTDWRAVRTDARDVLQRALSVLMQDTERSPAVTAELDALCRRRDDQTVADYQAAWVRTRGQLGGRPPRPPPKSGGAPAVPQGSLPAVPL